tara:strand:- start:65 stop:292 length:228 start_codon:yes stop_codon:yes gene_type:complete
MGVKSKLSELDSKVKSFPKLMCNEDFSRVIRFTSLGEGVIVFQKGHSMYKIFKHSYGWNMNKFKDYNGTIILENE